MTATIKRPGRHSANRKRKVRFASLESLGFTDVASTWSDSPLIEPGIPPDRPTSPPPRPGDVADWQPRDFGPRLTGSNVRWGMMITILAAVVAAASVGYWIYQRPVAVAQATDSQLTTQVEALETALRVLVELNQSLLDPEPAGDLSSLDSVESIARDLFGISGSLTEFDRRSAAAHAASSALDGVRLVRETHAYRAAVLPMLATPMLEADPELVGLDEAARSFGDWQRAFDDVRTALPEEFLSSVTEQLDILSGDLTSFLVRYVEALRQKDRAAVEYVLSSLTARLDATAQSLSKAVEGAHARVQARIEETLAALDPIRSR